MPASPRLVVIALDGTDPEIVAQRSAAGWIPTIAALQQRSTRAIVASDAHLFHTSTWPSFASGVTVANHGIHAFRPLRSGTLDFVDPARLETPVPFWETAARAGIRTAVLDMPIYGPPPPDANLPNLHFVEWGAHPELRPPGSYPPSLIRTIVDRHGQHPCRDDDPRATTFAELSAIRDRIAKGARARAGVVDDLLALEPELLVIGFSEIHTGAHQLLNLEDPRHPSYDAAIAGAFGESPLRAIYAAVDESVARILGRLSEETIVALVFLGGVRITYGGSRILEDLLLRMGLTVPVPPEPSRWKWIPAAIRSRVAKRLRGTVQRVEDERFRSAIEWQSTKAYALPATYDGYLRINLRGREPYGIVSPDQMDAILTRVEEAASSLTVAGSAEPAAREIVRVGDRYRGRAAHELPDLMVLWNNDRPLTAVTSAQFGTIVSRDEGNRPAHSTRGELLFAGGGIGGGPVVEGHDIDIAPTLLALLGVAPHQLADGRSLDAIMSRLGEVPA